MHRIPLALVIPFGIAVAQVPEHPVDVRLSAGYAWFSPGELNRTLTLVGHPEINGGITAHAEIGYFLTPQLSLNIGAGYLHGSSAGSLAVTGPTGPTILGWADETYSTTDIPIDLGIRYHFLASGEFDLAAGASGEIHLTSVKYRLESTSDSPGWDESRSKTGIGLRLSLASEYALTHSLSVTVDVGYRLADIKDINGEPGFLPARLGLDLSRPYAMAGVICRL
jgi:hypothetical protein